MIGMRVERVWALDVRCEGGVSEPRDKDKDECEPEVESRTNYCTTKRQSK
jgi:hypothetical protein